jgi:hypothetical protein
VEVNGRVLERGENEIPEAFEERVKIEMSTIDASKALSGAAND